MHHRVPLVASLVLALAGAASAQPAGVRPDTLARGKYLVEEAGQIREFPSG